MRGSSHRGRVAPPTWDCGSSVGNVWGTPVGTRAEVVYCGEMQQGDMSRQMDSVCLTSNPVWSREDFT